MLRPKPKRLTYQWVCEWGASVFGLSWGNLPGQISLQPNYEWYRVVQHWQGKGNASRVLYDNDTLSGCYSFLQGYLRARSAVDVAGKDEDYRYSHLFTLDGSI